MSIEDDDTLRGVVNAKIMSKAANDVLVKAHRAVRHTAKKIAMFRDLIAWFFTFGLVGLGMQITMASIRQAGGQPLVVGSVVGVIKAVGSLIVGVAFGAGWTPCIGPILGSILLYAGLESTMTHGTLLLGTYALGLGIPFVEIGRAHV